MSSKTDAGILTIVYYELVYSLEYTFRNIHNNEGNEIANWVGYFRQY